MSAETRVTSNMLIWLSYLRPPGWWPSAFRTLVLFRLGEYTALRCSFSLLCRAKEQRSERSAEDRGGASDARANAGLEVAANTYRDRIGAAVELKAIEIEAEALGSLPQVRVVDVATVAVERVDHLEEAALQARGLGGGVQGR